MFFGAAAEQFRKTISGSVLMPFSRDHDEVKAYHQAREVFNHAIDHRPQVIVRCKTPQDVVHSLQFAQDQQLEFSIRAGGHNACGFSVRDQGLVIDLSQMRDFRFDPEQRIARLQPGCGWRMLEPASYVRHGFQENGELCGLVATGGDCPDVLNTGFSLGGGHGLLGRQFGLGCDNILNAEIVMSDGRILQANGKENADLFWALRGGGCGNFGVVTALDFRLHALPKTVLAGYMEWPLDQAAEVMKHYRDIFLDEKTPDRLSFYTAFTRTPYPHGQPVLNIHGLYIGSPREGENWVQKLQKVGKPLHQQMEPCSYYDFITALGDEVVYGLRSKWKGGFFKQDGFSDEAIELIVDRFGRAPSPHSMCRFDLLGKGVIEKVPPTATAYVHRNTPFYISLLSLWEDPRHDDRNRRWIDEFHQDLAPFFNGRVYQNYVDLELEDWPEAYYGENYPRLQQIKRLYDPQNLFRHPQSIRLPDSSPL